MTLLYPILIVLLEILMQAVYEKQKENMEKVLAMQNVDVDRC